MRKAGLEQIELLLLLFTQTIAKSDDLNCFEVRSLRIPSLEREIQLAGAELASILKRLKNAGFLEPLGRHTLRCTSTANSVKHPFNRVRNEIKLRAGLGNEVNKVAFMATLIEEVTSRCREERRA